MLSAVINFLLVAAVVYFLIVVPFKKLKKDDPAVEDESTELTLLTEIRDLLQGQRPTRPADGAAAGPGCPPGRSTARPAPGTARQQKRRGPERVGHVFFAFVTSGNVSSCSTVRRRW